MGNKESLSPTEKKVLDSGLWKEIANDEIIKMMKGDLPEKATIREWSLDSIQKTADRLHREYEIEHPDLKPAPPPKVPTDPTPKDKDLDKAIDQMAKEKSEIKKKNGTGDSVLDDLFDDMDTDIKHKKETSWMVPLLITMGVGSVVLFSVYYLRK